MTQRQAALHMSPCTHTKAHCCGKVSTYQMNFHVSVHICSISIFIPDMRNRNNRLLVNVLLLQSDGRSKYSVSLPLPKRVTSLFAQHCAIGVTLSVCCVICCYASTSGMWILSLFYSGSLPLCQKRTNNPVKISFGVCDSSIWCFSFGTENAAVRFINECIPCICVKTDTE